MRLKMVLTLTGLLAACVTVPTGAPVPADPTFGREWESDADGFVYSAWYFTPEQERSSAWEAARVVQHNTATFCDGEKLVRRDVRWFDPDVKGGSKCAKVVYSFSCPVKHPGWGGSLEFEREQALLEEPDGPIPANCGDKDASKSSHAREPILSETRLTDWQISPDCPHLPADETTGQFELRPVTYIRARRLASPLFVTRLGEPVESHPGFLLALGSAPSKRHTVFVKRDIPPDDRTIFLDAVFMHNEHDGYCVMLEARQGHTIWRKTVKRTSVPKRDRNMVENKLSKDPAKYWDQYTDSNLLEQELALYMGLKLPEPYHEPSANRPD